LADFLEANVWFSSKVTDAIKKKFESVVWHHENVVKSAQHHRLAPGALPHDVLDGIIDHVMAVAKKKNLIPFVTFAFDLFQIEVSHLYSPILTSDKRIHTYPPRPDGGQLEPPQPLQIFAATNPL
jgi:hypothetical protein